MAGLGVVGGGAAQPFPIDSTAASKEAAFPRRSDPRYLFSAFLSSLNERQSVPWAMIFCGLDLIIPISRNRRA